MAEIITLPDGRRIIRSKGSLNKGKRRAKGAPPLQSNNRAARRSDHTDAPATARPGLNNHRINRNKMRTRARFS